MSRGKFSFGEWIALLSNPKPIKIVLTPNTSSNVAMIGILPPLLTGRGFLPKAFSKPLSAAW